MAGTGNNLSRCFDSSQTDLKQLIINGVLTSALIVFGLVGSLLSSGAFRNNRLCTRFAKFSLLLCGWDALLLICTFNFYALPTLIIGRKPWNGPLIYLYLVFYPLSNAAMTGGKWTILVLTWERFMAMRHPFAQRFRETRPAKLIIATVTLVSFALSTPLVFELRVYLCYSSLEGVVKPQIGLTALRSNAYYSYGYRIFVLFFVDTLFPFLTVLVLTVLALLSKSAPILNNARSLNLMGEERGPKRALMLAVIIKFLCCYSAPIALNIVELCFPTLYNNNSITTTVVDVANLIVVLHSATNWILFGRCNCAARKSSRTLEIIASKKASRVEYISQTQAQMLERHLTDRDVGEIGRLLIKAVLACNPGLAEPICQRAASNTNISELSTETEKPRAFRSQTNLQVPGVTLSNNTSMSDLASENEIETQLETQASIFGAVIGDFILKILHQLTQPRSNIFEIRRQIRNIGHTHYDRNICLRNSDWVVCKELLVAQILDANRDPILMDTASRFVSFIICEIKCGFLCQAVRDTQDSMVSADC